MKLTDIDPRLVYPVYVNEHLSSYYADLRYACKRLYIDKHISGYYVSGHIIKLFVNSNTERYILITHKEDLIDLFKDDPVIDASQYLDHMGSHR